MEEEKAKGKSKQELWEKVLYHHGSGKNISEIEKILGLSYEELMDVLIENVDIPEVKAALETARDIAKEFKEDKEKYERINKLRKQKIEELNMLEAYKKVQSSEPNYIS